MKNNFFLILAAAAVSLLAVSCGTKEKAGHVILIGLDGWGAYSVPKAEMPNVKQVMEDGCYTLEKRSVLPSSSAINWASMFNGAPTEIHGYTTWGSRTPELKSRVVNQHGIFPTIFSILRDAQPDAEIGCIYDWDGIKYLTDTLAMSYHAQGPDYQKQPDGLTEMAESYIKEKKPKLFAVCFDQPDHVGHEAGHDTPEYYEVLKGMDQRVGRILQAVKDAGIWDDSIIILTADHGGINKGHGSISLEEMQTPFIIAGKNVRKGGKFDQSMMQYDVASTIAYIFGLSQPQAWTGRPMIQVFK